MSEIPTHLERLKSLCDSCGIGFRYRKTSRSQKRLKSVEGTQVNFWTFEGSVVLTGIDEVSVKAWHEVVAAASYVCTGGWTTC